MLERGEEKTITLTTRLYAYGVHSVSVNGAGSATVRVVAPAEDTARFALSGMDVTPLVRSGDAIRASATVMNTGGVAATLPVRMVIDGRITDSATVDLAPGEARQITLASHATPGWHDVTVNGMEAHRTRVYANRSASCVLNLDFEDTGGAVARDRSGFGNDGIVRGPATWGEGRCGAGIAFPGDSYLELPSTSALAVRGEILTMMIWVRPDVSDRPDPYTKQYADIFSQGDQNLLKMNDPWTLSFIAGGWGRGEARAPVPPDWSGKWHHVAGVCDGRALLLYIDGTLVQTTPVEGGSSSTPFRWNVGRNAEYPIDRNFHGSLDEAKIFLEALSAEEIRAAMECGKPGQ